MIYTQLATHIMYVYTIKAGHCRLACNVRENTFIYGIDIRTWKPCRRCLGGCARQHVSLFYLNRLFIL